MKTVNYIMVAVAVTLGFSSCYDLDVAPYFLHRLGIGRRIQH